MSELINARSLELIKGFREKAPVVHQDNWVHLNQAAHPPTNEIVVKAINDHLNQLSHVVSLKPIFDSNIAKVKNILGEDFNIAPDSLLFTRNSSDGSILFSLLFKLNSDDNVLIMENEFPNLKSYWINFCESRNITLKQVKTTDSFHVATSTDFAPLVDSHTKLIVMSSQRYDTGIRNDVKSVTSAFRKQGIEVLVDCCQDVGLNRLDFTDLQVSAAIFSCFKGYTLPFGIGGLYVDPNLLATLNPVFTKTEHICDNFEPHSAPHLLVHAWLQILLFYKEIGIDNIEIYLRSLGHKLSSGLNELGIELPKRNGVRSSHSYVYHITNPQWFDFLQKEKIIVSQHGNMRISFGLHNNEEDVDRIIKAFKKGLDLELSLN